MIAEASEAKKNSTFLSSKGSNSDVDPVLGRVAGNSGFPCGRYSTISMPYRQLVSNLTVIC